MIKVTVKGKLPLQTQLMNIKRRSCKNTVTGTTARRGLARDATMFVMRRKTFIIMTASVMLGSLLSIREVETARKTLTINSSSRYLISKLKRSTIMVTQQSTGHMSTTIPTTKIITMQAAII